MRARPEPDDIGVPMIIFAAVILAMVVVAACLMISTLCRNESILGFAALVMMVIAGLAGVVYAGLDSG
jgi:uncharacterized membrane protein YhhN